MARLDTNQNRLLEESEAQAAGRQLFGSLDENRDGRLQPEEIKGRLGGPVQTELSSLTGQLLLVMMVR